VRGTSIGGGRAACQGRYRRGLVQAAKTLTPEGASVLLGLEANGLDVNQLREVLGEHVLWTMQSSSNSSPKVTRERLSSYHKTVGQHTYPDLGYMDC
jgi:hypothetical protein